MRVSCSIELTNGEMKDGKETKPTCITSGVMDLTGETAPPFSKEE